MRGSYRLPILRADRSNHHGQIDVQLMGTDDGERVSHLISDAAEHEIFDGLNDADLADLDDRFAMATFRKGELIYSPFDRGDALFLIQSGRVRLFRSASDGRQVTLAMLDAGSAFGQISRAGRADARRLRRGHDRHAWCGCCGWPTWSGRSAEHPRMALNLMRSLAERLRTAEDQIEALAFRRVPARLAAQAAGADGPLRPGHAHRHPHRRALHAHAAGRDDRHQPRDADQGA